MIDVVAQVLSQSQIRWLSVLSDFVAAFVIGPWLAFAVTRDAGFRCRSALIRMGQRAALVMFSIALMYNALLVYSMGRTPIGSALLVNVFILITTLISAYRHVQAPAIPKYASWSRPMVVRAEIAKAKALL